VLIESNSTRDITERKKYRSEPNEQLLYEMIRVTKYGDEF